MLNVLFLCTHNAARSILAEALLNHLAAQEEVPRFRAYSAGSSPREHQQPHPVKENPDGTIYYKGWVYRKIGDHGPKTPREQRRRHWKKAGKAA